MLRLSEFNFGYVHETVLPSVLFIVKNSLKCHYELRSEINFRFCSSNRFMEIKYSAKLQSYLQYFLRNQSDKKPDLKVCNLQVKINLILQTIKLFKYKDIFYDSSLFAFNFFLNENTTNQRNDKGFFLSVYNRLTNTHKIFLFTFSVTTDGLQSNHREIRYHNVLFRSKADSNNCCINVSFVTRHFLFYVFFECRVDYVDC